MSTQKFINYIKDKEILILGFGREGKSTYNFIRKYLPGKKITIGDKNDIALTDKNLSFDCGEDYLKHLDHYDLVFKSPGIPFVGVDYPVTTEITCQTDMLLRHTDCTTVGITGTKGKTTTSTLIYEILDEAGINVFLAGNMGLPVLEYMDRNENCVAVVEMSSHQLEFTSASPHIAVVTNIYEEHLDHYTDGFKGYVNAKFNIVRYQRSGDYFIFNDADLENLNEYIDENEINGIKVIADDADNTFVRELSHVNKNLRGAHNCQDIGYAYAVASKCFYVKDAIVKSAIEKFKGIPNRMEYIGTFRGVEYYNDSIATIPKATECAVEALGNVGTLIIGGLDRGIDYDDFEKSLSDMDIDSIVCIPDTGYKIADALRTMKCKAHVVTADDLSEAVKYAVENTAAGKACLMSPAAASYNVYRDFEEKGNHYKQLVNKYCKNE